MKPIFYGFCGLGGFASVALIGQLFAAYPSLRLGVAGLILVVLFAVLVFALWCMMQMRSHKGEQLEPEEILTACLPAIAVLAVVICSLTYGLIVGGG